MIKEKFSNTVIKIKAKGFQPYNEFKWKVSRGKLYPYRFLLLFLVGRFQTCTISPLRLGCYANEPQLVWPVLAVI